MSQLTLLIDLAPLSQRMMRILLESVKREVHTIDDTQELPGLLTRMAFKSIVISTLGSIRDPLIVAQQVKSLQPTTHVLLWGPRSIKLKAIDKAYVDDQLLMPCTLAELDSVLRSSRNSTLFN